jgi:hypothetical protein
MGIVMGDSAGQRAYSQMMGSMNASNHVAKVLQRCDALEIWKSVI